jgi:hypothetical protein
MPPRNRAKRVWTSAKSTRRRIESDSRIVGSKVKRTAMRVGRATQRGAGRLERTVAWAGRKSKVTARKILHRRKS